MVLGDLIQRTFEEVTVVHGFTMLIFQLSSMVANLTQPSLTWQKIWCYTGSYWIELALLIIWQFSHKLTSQQHWMRQVRDILLWKQINWSLMWQSLLDTNWKLLLTGDAEYDVGVIISHNLNIQWELMFHHVYSTRRENQPWFGYRWRILADVI